MSSSVEVAAQAVGLIVEDFEIPETYDVKPLYEMVLSEPIEGMPSASPRRGRPPPVNKHLLRQDQQRFYEGNLLRAMRTVAADAGIATVDELVSHAPLCIDMGGVLWQPRQICLVEVRALSALGVRLYEKQFLEIVMRGGILTLGAMITELLVALASSAPLRERVRGKRVAALGWNNVPGFTGYPCISPDEPARVYIQEDGFPPGTLFAFKPMP